MKKKKVLAVVSCIFSVGAVTVLAVTDDVSLSVIMVSLSVWCVVGSLILPGSEEDGRN